MTTLYRKYRPSTFGEISGQKYTLQALTNAIKNNQVSHAYLLTGPRGTGKTTTARIFAKAVNCLKPIISDSRIALEPCNECTNCQMILANKAIDLIEIDAASHTGVDNIRQLKEAINIPPTNFKYKVYIIDEVHMLSMGAFNALLKTLEEPPAHAIFILATTEFHKVPETIISRCQQFNIKPLTKNQILTRLEQIAKEESVEIDKEALTIIATEAGGGMRDAESLLGQIISLGNKTITAENTQQILGISPKSTLDDLIKTIVADDITTTITSINKLQENGVNIKSFGKQLLNYLRDLMLLKISEKDEESLIKNLTTEEITKLQKLNKDFTLQNIAILISLLQNSLSKTNQSDIPQLPLEMALIEYFLKTTTESTQPSQEVLKKKSITNNNTPSSTISNTSLTTPPETPQPIAPPETSQPTNIPAPSITPPKQVSTNEPESPVEEETENPLADLPSSDSLSINTFLDSWSDIITETRKDNLSTAGFLENCAPTAIQNGIVIIKTKYPFNKEQLNKPPTKLTIEKIFGRILKVALRVNFVTEKELGEVPQLPAPETKSATLEKESSASTNNNDILYEAMKQIGGTIIKGS